MGISGRQNHLNFTAPNKEFERKAIQIDKNQRHTEFGLAKGQYSSPYVEHFNLPSRNLRNFCFASLFQKICIFTLLPQMLLWSVLYMDNIGIFVFLSFNTCFGLKTFVNPLLINLSYKSNVYSLNNSSVINQNYKEKDLNPSSLSYSLLLLTNLTFILLQFVLKSV